MSHHRKGAVHAAPMRVRPFAALLAALLCGTLLFSGASSAKPIASKDLFKNADVVSAKLSPDGKSVAIVSAVNGKKRLAVMDIATGNVQQVAAYADAEIGSFRWVNENRLVYALTYLYDEHAWTGYVEDGLFAVNRDGSDVKELCSTVEKQVGNHTAVIRTMQVDSLISDRPDEILVEEHNGKDYDVHAYRVNTVTGQKREVVLSFAPEVHAFWADRGGSIRLARTASSDVSKETLWYRETTESPWRKINEVTKLDAEFEPADFDTDNRTLLVSAHEGNDKSRLYKFDFANNKVGELFYANDEANVGHGLIFAQDTHKLMGVQYDGDQPGVHWIDQKRNDIQQAIDDALPGQVNLISGDDNAKVLLVHSYSDVNPGVYYLYTLETHKLKKLFSTRPWIHAEDLSQQLVFHYNARDGLDIPAYLTLPKGKTAKKLPLIVLAHGGPWARDEWGFNEEVQFLASRGYVVLQPQFRSSTGLGFNLFRKGWKEWGMSMQDDITDGVKNLIKQGVVDSGKVCIMGGSYGGYATMMGLVKEPDLYRCGINMFGVTDIKLQNKISDWSDDDDFQRYDVKQLIGDFSKDAAHFDDISPLKQVAKIKAPVLMVYGAKDKRVPLEQGEKMRDALKKQGGTVEWMEFAEEGHGFANKEEDRFQFFDALDAFLKKYNPVD